MENPFLDPKNPLKLVKKGQIYRKCYLPNDIINSYYFHIPNPKIIIVTFSSYSLASQLLKQKL